MNTLKNILAISVIASATVSVTAQSDELMDIIYPEMAKQFQYEGGLQTTEPSAILSLNDNYSSGNTWSYEYEEYVNQADYSLADSIANPAMVNRYIENNPTAAGHPSGHLSEPVFKWDENYDGYMVY